MALNWKWSHRSTQRRFCSILAKHCTGDMVPETRTKRGPSQTRALKCELADTAAEADASQYSSWSLRLHNFSHRGYQTGIWSFSPHASLHVLTSPIVLIPPYPPRTTHSPIVTSGRGRKRPSTPETAAFNLPGVAKPAGRQPVIPSAVMEKILRMIPPVGG